MITKEKSPIRILFFRDHEISGLRPAARQGPQHFNPVGTVNQNTLDFARYQQAAARTGGEITIDHPIGGHR
jgi:hypothetical protein